jgi:diguanylate cyclase (GGDEF)-like protein
MAESNLDDLTIEDLHKRIHQLEAENKRWMHLAGTNRLTDLPNNMMLFKVVLPAELRKWDGKETNLSCLVISPDGLGELNQKHGREVGDQFIVEMAKFLKGCLRGDEKLYHPDGSNFAILLLGIAGGRARRRGTEIKTEFHASTFKLEKAESSDLTCSVGVASLEQTIDKKEIPDLVDRLYHTMSNGLYKAKQRGGNLVA